MAQTPYALGSGAPPPEVDPNESSGNVARNIRVSPEAFGGGVAQGMREAGAAEQNLAGQVTHIGQVWGKVATDDALNGAFESAEKLKQEFLGKQGRDAVLSKDDYDKQLDEIRKNYGAGLMTSDQQQEFDSSWRRFHTINVQGPMDSHYNQQALVSAKDVNESTIKNRLTSIAASPDADDVFTDNLERARHAAVKNVELHGGSEEDAQAAIFSTTAAAWKTRIESISVNDPSRARKMAEEHKADLGVHYETTAIALAHRANEQIAIGAADKHVAIAKEAQQTQFAQAPGGVTGYGKTNVPYRAALDKPGKGGVLSPQDHFQYLKSQGATNNEALLLTSAAGSESLFDPTAVHDGGAGHGLYGHNDGRLNMVGKTWQQQATAALQELRGRPEHAMVASAQTPEQLADAEMHFEQPRGYTQANPRGSDNYTGRLNTIRYFSQMAGGAVQAGAGVGGASPAVGAAGAAARLTPAATTGQYPPGLQPAIFTDFPATPPPPPPPQPSPEQTLAATYRSIDADDSLTDVQKDMAKRKAHEKLAMDAVEEEQTAKARRTAADEASQQIFTMMTSENGMDRAKAANILANNLDPRLATPEAFSRRKELWAMLNKPDKEDTGRVYGEGYSKDYDDLFSGKITSLSQIYQHAAPGGPLTNAGADRLAKIWKETKDADKQASHATFSGIMKQLEEDFGADQKSEDKYAKRDYHYNIFPAMESAFSDVMANGQKKDVDKFLRELPDNARKMNDSLRSPEKRALQRMDDLIEQARVNTETAAVAAESTMPKDPEFTRTGVKQENWTQAMALPRPGNMPANEWAIRLHDFALAPTAGNAAIFDNVYRRPGAGKSILDTLGIPMVDGPASTIKKPAAETAYPPPPAPANYFEKRKPAPVGRSIKQFEESLAIPGEAKIAGEQ